MAKMVAGGLTEKVVTEKVAYEFVKNSIIFCSVTIINILFF